MNTLGLERYSDRCAQGFALVEHHPELCDCMGAAQNKERGIAASNGKAPPEQRARIDDAIRRVAARGGEFSANEVRLLVREEDAPFMGGRFNTLGRLGVIVRVGYVASSKGNTNGHEIKTWKGAAA